MFTEGRKGEAGGRTLSLPSGSSGSNYLDRIHRFKEDFHNSKEERTPKLSKQNLLCSVDKIHRGQRPQLQLRGSGWWEEQSGGGAGALREEVTPMPALLLTALSAVSLERWGRGVPQALACSPPSAQPNNSAVRAPQSPFPASIIPWPITSSCAHPRQQNCPHQGRQC